MTVADLQTWWPAIVAGLAVGFACTVVPLTRRSLRRELRRTTKEVEGWKDIVELCEKNEKRFLANIENERRKSDHYARAIARLVAALPTAEPLPTDPFLPHRRAVYDRLRLVVLDAFKDVQ